MPSKGVLAAIAERYNGLTFPNKPAILWFGDAALKTAAGATALPTAELFDEGGTNKLVAGQTLRTINVRIEVFADSMESLEDIERGLKYGSGAPEAGLGLHRALTLPFDANSTYLAMVQNGEAKIEFQMDRSYQANRVYKMDVKFTVEYFITG